MTSILFSNKYINHLSVKQNEFAFLRSILEHESIVDESNL